MEIEPDDEQREDQWWTVTPAGGAVLAGVLLISGLLGFWVKRDLDNRIRADDDKMRLIAEEMNSFSDELRCIEDVTWRLTSDDALDAEFQLQLADAGLRSQPVDRRLC